MQEELNKNITDLEGTSEQVVENTDDKKEPTTLTFTEEELHKRLQSERSKSKNDILKELGINSVKEFQELKNTYENAINEKNTLETNLASLNKDKEKLQEDLMLSRLGVSEEYGNDLLTLAKSKVDENHSLEEVSKELLEKYPQWRNSKESIRIGTEKTDNKAKEPEVDSELLKKYAWLR